jgi:glycosyltransferase involved in cell wall biosynthesis
VIIVTNVHRAQSDGGVERSTFQLARGLAGRGHRVNLIYGQGGDLVPEFRRICASVHHVRYSDYTFPESRARALLEHVRLLPAVALAAKCRPDVYYMNRTFAAEWALQAAKLSPAPVVCHWRGTQTPGPRYLASLSAKVSRFVANSAFTRDVWLAAGIDPGKVDVVYAGLDPAEYPQGGAAEREAARVELDIPEDLFVAVFVGRLDAEKGVEVLLDAWRRLALSPDEAQLLVVGAPVLHSDHQAYLDHLKALAPAGTVRFLGARRDVVTPLHAADVAVVPSTWDEPFGRTVIEALATGRPVAGSRVGGIPEMLSGPFERFLFERGDAAGLAGVLSGLRGWQEREPDLGERCAAHVRDHFSVELMVDGIEAAIGRALGARSRS